MTKKAFNPSRFKKLEISPRSAKKIASIQDSFERFANHLQAQCKDNDEFRQGLIRLQEACVWFSRSIAMMSAYDLHRKMGNDAGEVDQKKPLETTAPTKPKIIIKKKKAIS